MFIVDDIQFYQIFKMIFMFNLIFFQFVFTKLNM